MVQLAAVLAFLAKKETKMSIISFILLIQISIPTNVSVTKECDYDSDCPTIECHRPVCEDNRCYATPICV